MPVAEEVVTIGLGVDLAAQGYSAVWL